MRRGQARAEQDASPKDRADALQKLIDLAGQAAETHERWDAARKSEIDANENALKVVARAVASALSSVSDRPVLQRDFHEGAEEVSVVRASWHGVRLNEIEAGPRRRLLQSDHGVYEGTDLFLRVDSTWAEVVYRGRFAPNVDRWTGEVKLTSVREVAERYDVDSIIRVLVNVFAAAIERNVERNEQSNAERLSTLRALTLLTGPAKSA